MSKPWSSIKHKKKCTVPPPCWRCTRDGGHDGPCAAISTEVVPWIKEAVSKIQLRNRIRGHVLQAVRSGETSDVMTSAEMEQIIAETFEAATHPAPIVPIEKINFHWTGTSEQASQITPTYESLESELAWNRLRVEELESHIASLGTSEQAPPTPDHQLVGETAGEWAARCGMRTVDRVLTEERRNYGATGISLDGGKTIHPKFEDD